MITVKTTNPRMKGILFLTTAVISSDVTVESPALCYMPEITASTEGS